MITCASLKIKVRFDCRLLVHVIFYCIACLPSQVLTKEQLYVKPSQSVSPTSLPGGIKPEAVNSAATLPVIVKQVYTCIELHVSYIAV